MSEAKAIGIARRRTFVHIAAQRTIFAVVLLTDLMLYPPSPWHNMTMNPGSSDFELDREPASR